MVTKMNVNHRNLIANYTTALTCLTSLIIINTQPANAASTSGQFTAQTVMSPSCTLSASTMGFAAYTGILITATSNLVVNCTNAAPFTLSFSDTDHTGGLYKLTRASSPGSATTDYLNIFFKNAAPATMTNAGATITGTGTGASATAGTVTGVIPASQLGRFAGTFAKIMTMQITY